MLPNTYKLWINFFNVLWAVLLLSPEAYTNNISCNKCRCTFNRIFSLIKKLMNDWLAHWLTDWLACWLTSWLVDYLIHWLVDWLIVLLINWFIICISDGLTDWFVIKESHRESGQFTWVVNWNGDYLRKSRIKQMTLKMKMIQKSEKILIGIMKKIHTCHLNLCIWKENKAAILAFRSEPPMRPNRWDGPNFMQKIKKIV